MNRFLEFVGTCSKAFCVSILAGFVGLCIGGNQMKGCFVAIITMPVVFLISLLWFARESGRTVPEPVRFRRRKLVEFRKKQR
jgi:hypothetical protein